MRRFFTSQTGFTWIEMVLLVALLGIGSALAVPRIRLIFEQRREADTRQNIGTIKSAISIYYGDHEGIWPETLDVNDKTPGFGFGNYLDSMPAVKVTFPRDHTKSPAGNQVTYKSYADDPNLGALNSNGRGWRYDGPKQGNTGRIWVNSSYTDTTGVSYTTYGYQ